MILLAGIPTEPPLELAIASAEAANIKYVVLNQRAFRHDDIELRLVGGHCEGILTVGMQSFPLDAFTGIYTRMTDPQSLPELQTHPRRLLDVAAPQRANIWNETFNAWLELAPQRVANRNSATLSNFSKPYQAQKIRAAGFQVPETLVTNDPEEVRNFQKQHRRIIYKSTSSIRSIVRVLDDEAMKNLDRITFLPTQFQACIYGDDVRVHVVDQHIFAARIKSEAIDYRYAGRDGLDVDMTIHELPEEIAQRCIDLSRALNLPFCGIDFKRTSGGNYICFEVNPSPAYSYYQEQTGIPISDALVSYLAGESDDMITMVEQQAA